MEQVGYWLKHLAGLVVCIAITGGCFRQSGPAKPAFDPAGSAAQAIQMYDANSDTFIDSKEVAASPGLKAAFPRIDRDGDGKLSASEIQKRIEYYKSAPTTIVMGATRVTLNGRLLIGAEVTFEPESFLGDAFVPCSGITEENGVAQVMGHDANYPGIYLGFYRVRISRPDANGKEMVPTKYNDETILGYEATDDIPLVADNIAFDLK